jgi:hypothetical protein
VGVPEGDGGQGLVDGAGRAYRFRCLLDGQRRDNDRAADASVRNDFGGDDPVAGLAALAEAIPPAAKKASAEKEPMQKAASAQADQKAAAPAAEPARKPARAKAG